MSRYVITGGQPLSGEVSLRGAKNASFKEIIAALLTDQTVHLTNLPIISDVKITESIAKSLGTTLTVTGDHSLDITAAKLSSSIVPNGTGEKSRTSFMFAAPLLCRLGTAKVPLPGGDRLGARPLDRLFDCFTQMGITTEITDTSLIFNTNKTKPVNYAFPKPSHTVTEVVIMVAALTPGQSIFDNAAIEPEIDDLILMLNSMGADIHRQADNPKKIIVEGVSSLHDTNHQVISDRNEAVTFGCAALATKGSINILQIDPNIIGTFLRVVDHMGATVNRGQNEVSISWEKPLKAVDIITGPEPEFMTDWQAIFTVVLTQAVGCSSIIERVYPYRFHHLENLQKMGLKAKFFQPDVADPDSFYQFNRDSDRPEYFHGVKIYGPSKLNPGRFNITDLRSGASATLAALTAPGESIIDGVEYIERGYEKLAQRLCSLGANIQYIKT